jgi:hypothetical protein
MLPNLIVIGAAKAGTTTLHHHLGLHPEIAMSATKELRFFLDRHNWNRGPEWYSAQFPDDAPVRGESSPRYTGYPFNPDVPERMAALIPDARLIYILRDPIDRLVSDYEMVIRAGNAEEPLSKLVDDPEDSWFVARSRYWFQLERFLRHYPPERILVLDATELATGTAALMARAFRFLGVDDTFTSPAFADRLNVAREPPRVRNGRGEHVVRALDRVLGESRSQRLRAAAPTALHRPFSQRVGSAALSRDERARLEDFLRPDAERLRAHTGLPFSDWSV